MALVGIRPDDLRACRNFSVTALSVGLPGKAISYSYAPSWAVLFRFMEATEARFVQGVYHKFFYAMNKGESWVVLQK